MRTTNRVLQFNWPVAQRCSGCRKFFVWADKIYLAVGNRRLTFCGKDCVQTWSEK